MVNKFIIDCISIKLSICYIIIDSHQSSLKAVIKRSWGHKIYLTFPPSTPAQAVSKECSVLKKLEYFGVPNVPKCIASCYDSEADHTTMIMQPLFIGSKPTDTNPDTSSIKGMTSSSSRITATRKLATTIVQLLGEAHIFTTGLSDHSPSSLFSSQPVKISVSSKSSSDIVIDKSNDPEIQILVNSDSGDILVIDFSESKELVVGNNGLFSEKDLQLADAFLRSAVSLVPKDCITEWQGVIQSYLNNGGSKENKIHPQLKELFHKYT